MNKLENVDPKQNLVVKAKLKLGKSRLMCDMVGIIDKASCVTAQKGREDFLPSLKSQARDLAFPQQPVHNNNNQTQFLHTADGTI